MRDTDLYRRLLGLESPWTVDRVDLDVKTRQVDVYAKHEKQKAWPCPECKKPCGLHDHDAERIWRHLDSCGFGTFLHARVPRVSCPEHGVRQVRVPWAEPSSRFTALFEQFAIDVLLETSITGAAEILGITWDEAHHLMARAVARGLARRPHVVPRQLGVDEKAIAKGQRYATMLVDLEHGHVVEIAEGRTTESLLACLGRFSINELSTVEAIAMDMWAPYAQVFRAVVDDADDKIVYDRFHIVGHMNEAVDQVRRRENKELRADGDDRLVGSKHLWLYGDGNIPPDRYDLDKRIEFAKLKSSGEIPTQVSFRACSAPRTVRSADMSGLIRTRRLYSTGKKPLSTIWIANAKSCGHIGTRGSQISSYSWHSSAASGFPPAWKW